MAKQRYVMLNPSLPLKGKLRETSHRVLSEYSAKYSEAQRTKDAGHTCVLCRRSFIAGSAASVVACMRRLRRLPAGWPLALAPARAADQLVLERVVAIGALDAGAHTFDRVPHADQPRVAPVAQVGQ